MRHRAVPVPTIPPLGAGPRPRWSVMIPTCNDADLLPLDVGLLTASMFVGDVIAATGG